MNDSQSVCSTCGAPLKDQFARCYQCTFGKASPEDPAAVVTSAAPTPRVVSPESRATLAEILSGTTSSSTSKKIEQAAGIVKEVQQAIAAGLKTPSAKDALTARRLTVKGFEIASSRARARSAFLDFVFFLIASRIAADVFGVKLLNLTWNPEHLMPSFVALAIIYLTTMMFCASPGKLLTGLRIVDQTTGDPPSAKMLKRRFIFTALMLIFWLPFGFLWFLVLKDPRMQGVHDKFAQTIVVKKSGMARI